MFPRILKPVIEPKYFGGLVHSKIDIEPGAVICLANDLLHMDRISWFVPVWMI